MNLIKDLKAVLKKGAYTETRGILATVMNEPRPGLIRKVQLGAAGIVITRDTVQVAIPLKELLKLADHLVPELNPPKEPSAIRMEEER